MREKDDDRRQKDDFVCEEKLQLTRFSHGMSTGLILPFNSCMTGFSGRHTLTSAHPAGFVPPQYLSLRPHHRRLIVNVAGID